MLEVEFDKETGLYFVMAFEVKHEFENWAEAHAYKDEVEDWLFSDEVYCDADDYPAEEI